MILHKKFDNAKGRAFDRPNNISPIPVIIIPINKLTIFFLVPPQKVINNPPMIPPIPKLDCIMPKKTELLLVFARIIGARRALENPLKKLIIKKIDNKANKAFL